jgi:putative DNA primase/helicase
LRDPDSTRIDLRTMQRLATRVERGRSGGGDDPMKSLMLEHGFEFDPVPDGKFHRFRGPDDKRENCWCIFYGDHGAFGNWRTGEHYKWSERGQLSPDESIALSKKIAADKRRRMKETAERHAKAADEAQAVWQAATPCISHDYLTRKAVQSHRLRVKNDALLVPMYAGKKLWNLQTIYPDGTKRFRPGGKVSGCYYPIGRPTGRLWLAEGYATAATLHELTGDAVACCFNANNIPKVAAALKPQFPGLKLLIGADNDNAGISAAERAAEIASAKIILPEFDQGDDGTDWNDYAATYGHDITREQINAVA